MLGSDNLTNTCHGESLLEELEGLRDNANTQTERDMLQRLIDEMENR